MRRDYFIQTTSEIRQKAIVTDSLINAYSSYVLDNYVDFEDEERVLYQRVEQQSRFRYSGELDDIDEDEFLRLMEKMQKAETFSDMLLRLIREKNKKAPEVYKKAGIDYRHFSKINSRRDYKATKETVLAFALALELSLSQTEELLNSAGYSFSPSSLFDVSIKFFLENHYYDRNKIDLILDKLGIDLLPKNF